MIKRIIAELTVPVNSIKHYGQLGTLCLLNDSCKQTTLSNSSQTDRVAFKDNSIQSS
jgi:hypothetical protein